MTKSAEQHARNLSATETTGIQCELDKVWVHSIAAYLPIAHPTTTLADYQNRYPDAPIKSATLENASRQKALVQAAATAVAPSNVVSLHPELPAWGFGAPSKATFSNVFELGDVKASKNTKGDPIEIEVLGDCGDELRAFVPPKDVNHIWNIDDLKALMMASAMRFNFLAWGMHGTGKTALIEQYCARTNRPMIRVQHTATTEESHILGQYILKGGETIFELGPLAVAMKYGLVYLADEYDFALPNVTAVYQPVMEGKALVIKEAPAEHRVIHPHPNFRFCATGNTNGGGDETGLYQGTQMQNAANYSRFGITVEISYMPEKQEIMVVAAQAGIHSEDAEKLVKVAAAVRDAYRRSEIGVTVSPRELINAGKLGRVLGGKWKQGLDLAYLNRLNPIDRKAVSDMAQRHLV
jgi:cobaltochelatase CobS